jgi:hypothetical protein
MWVCINDASLVEETLHFRQLLTPPKKTILQILKSAVNQCAPQSMGEHEDGRKNPY